MKMMIAQVVLGLLRASLLHAQQSAPATKNAELPAVPVKWLAEAIQLAGPPAADTPKQLQIKAGDRIMAVGDVTTVHSFR